MTDLFTPLKIGSISLKHRIVMAPTTRMRATEDGIPTDLMVKHYQQRATQGGLLIAEATTVSPYAKAYACGPGIFNSQQMIAWKKIVDAVHAKGGYIFLQLWHPGRQSLPELSENHSPVAPSALVAKDTYGVIKTSDGEFEGKLFPQPRELTIPDIKNIISEFKQAAERAKNADFDGVEIHAANGYLPDQFLQDTTNLRTDKYGGNLRNRARFLIECIEAVKEIWGNQKVGVRISPSGKYGDMKDSNPAKTFKFVAEELSEMDLSYLHIIEPRVIGPEDVEKEEKVDLSPVATTDLRPYYKGLIISAGGFTPQSAEGIIKDGTAEMVAFGRYFTSNPDLVARIRNKAHLSPYDRSTFFGGNEKGYNDFQVHL